MTTAMMMTTTATTGTTATPTRPAPRVGMPTPPPAAQVPAAPAAAPPIAAPPDAATQAGTGTIPAVRDLMAGATPGGGAEHPCPWLARCGAPERSHRVGHHRGCVGRAGGRGARMVIRGSTLVHAAPHRGPGVAARGGAGAGTARAEG